MEEREIIKKTIAFIKLTLNEAEGGHDWWHVHRVWQLSKRIAMEEGADLFIVELAALLHDIADSKFNGGDEEAGPAKAAAFMKQMHIEKGKADHVINIIRNMSFRSSLGKVDFNSLELQVVQDADRLDAMGAIGIARAFNYGGFKNRKLYDPSIKPNLNMTKEEYKKSDAPTVNHFYEKLFLLKDKMNTTTGKALAAERHQFMEQYLEQFYKEWSGDA